MELASGEELLARAAVLAIDPAGAVELLDMPSDAPLARWTAGCLPVRAACLDLALSRVPRPQCRVAFDLDRPLYFSVHSASARLAPEGVHVLHVMKYLRSSDRPSADDIEGQLEDWLDGLQPGWRTVVVARQFLPGMTVTPSLPVTAEGALAGRPGVDVDGYAQVFLAGDWVGPEGMLADASSASARQAARRVLDALSSWPASPIGSLSHATA